MSIKVATRLADEALAAAKAFIANGFEARPKRWWFDDAVKSFADGWPTVFSAGNYHCVYCRKNLSLTIEDLVASTTDHVVPQLLFTGTGEQGPNHLRNLVPCCSVCNSIKGDWYPEPGTTPWETRRAFIEAARDYIKQRKREKARHFHKHLGAAQLHIWDPKNPGHRDFI